MTDSKTTVSFDDIINAERNRRKNETLANEIFGRNKHNKDASSRNDRTSVRGSGHPGRMGITKRSSSTASTTSSKNPFSPPSRPSSAKAQHLRTNRIASAIESDLDTTNAPKPAKGPGFSIKGKAGPSIVEASNFANGTTAADIEAALNEPELTSCRVVATHPQVKAELVFATRSTADRVISTYNNMEADFRILKFSYKNHDNSPDPSAPPTSTNSKDLFEQNQPADTVGEDVDMTADESIPTQPRNATGSGGYDNDREAADRERESSRRITDQGHDGNRYDNLDDRNGSRRDDTRDRGRDSRRYEDRHYDRRDGRDHDGDRGRDRDRDRGGREQDRNRERPSGPSYHRSDSYQNQGRGSRSSHYGNGVGGVGRGNINSGPSTSSPSGPSAASVGDSGGGRGGPPGRGGPGMGGRMYSDDMMRGRGGGGRGGRGGGFRGGYRGY